MAAPVNGATGRWLSAWVVLLLLCLSPAHAHSHDRDLGPIPISGTEAARTLPDRKRRVISELACGDEATFMRGLREAPKDRPLSHLVAKAAAFSGATSPDYLCEITQAFEPDEWDANFAHESEITQPPATRPPLGPPGVLVDASWPALKDALNALNDGIFARTILPPDRETRAAANAAEILRLINRIEGTIYGEVCNRVVHDVTPVVHEPIGPYGRGGFVEYRISYQIQAGCLEQQINTLILARDFQRTGNPGTDALPCLLLGKTKGDWDQAVTQLTRATFYLRRAFAERTAISDNTRAALDKLQTRLLTLSGEPAVEVHSIAKCGNPDNSYGAARQRLDGETFYDPELQRDVQGKGEGGNGFLDFLGGLLLFFALVIAGLALAALAAILTALFGPLLAAIIMIVGLAIAVAEGIPQTIIGAIFGGIEETENHLFMQNSSKYLMNKILMEQLHADGDEDGARKYEEFNDEIRDWFLGRLRRIADEDFTEYNAKPYTRLTVSSLLNIHDFSCNSGPARTFDRCNDDDRNLTTAAALVLDLNAAKTALGSNQSRRIVPFRRLAHANTSFNIGHLQDNGKRSAPYRLMDLGLNADHMEAAMQLWTGMTFHGPGGHASTESLSEMLWEATSRYSPHALILDVAIDKSTPYQQTFHHAGWERYSSGPGWLLTAGGSSTGYAQGFVTPFGRTYPSMFIKDSDRGAGVPTSLIVASIPRRELWVDFISISQQDLWADFIRFEGKRETWRKDENNEPMTFDHNFCVMGSFACGVNLQIPEALRTCLVPSSGVETPSPRVLLIGDSSDKARCGLWDDEDPKNDFFVVLYSQPCAATGKACGRGGQWGFVEIVPRSRFADRAALARQILNSNAANLDAMGRSGGSGTSTYQSVTGGTIEFDPSGSFVRSVNGTKMDDDDSPDWPRAQGGIVNRTGDITYTITNPRTGQMIFLDFSDRKVPKRVLP